jgi:hypothetical protein
MTFGMTYRLAHGPAGLRLEIPALIKGVANRFDLEEDRIAEWPARHAGFDRHMLQETQERAVPIPFVQAEIARPFGPFRRFPSTSGWSSFVSPALSTWTRAMSSTWSRPAARLTRPGW